MGQDGGEWRKGDEREKWEGQGPQAVEEQEGAGSSCGRLRTATIQKLVAEEKLIG